MAVARVGDKWYDVGDLYGSKSFEGLTGKAYANKKKELDQQVLSGNYAEVDLNSGMLKGTNTPFRTDLIGAQPKSGIQTNTASPVKASAVNTQSPIDNIVVGGSQQNTPTPPTTPQGETGGLFYKNGKAAFDNWFSNVGAGGITDQEKSNLSKALEQGKINQSQYDSVFKPSGMFGSSKVAPIPGFNNLGVRDFSDKQAYMMNMQYGKEMYARPEYTGEADLPMIDLSSEEGLASWAGYYNANPDLKQHLSFKEQSMLNYLQYRSEAGEMGGDKARKLANQRDAELRKQYGLPQKLDVGDGELDNWLGTTAKSQTGNPLADALGNYDKIGGYYDLDGDMGKLGRSTAAVGPLVTMALAAIPGGQALAPVWNAFAAAAQSGDLSSAFKSLGKDFVMSHFNMGELFDKVGMSGVPGLKVIEDVRPDDLWDAIDNRDPMSILKVAGRLNFPSVGGMDQLFDAKTPEWLKDAIHSVREFTDPSEELMKKAGSWTKDQFKELDSWFEDVKHKLSELTDPLEQVGKDIKDALPNGKDIDNPFNDINLENPLPKIDVPDMNLPNVDLPNVEFPNIDIPNIDLPNIDLPNFDLPDVSLGGLSSPSSWSDFWYEMSDFNPQMVESPEMQQIDYLGEALR